MDFYLVIDPYCPPGFLRISDPLFFHGLLGLID